MISVSSAFTAAMAENTNVMVRGDLHLADGTDVSLVGDDFMMGGISLTQATSSSSGFDIGAAVIGSCDITLNNVDGRFDDYDFTGATIRPYIGKPLPDGTIEWVRKPKYYVDQPNSYGTSIGLTGLDSMSLLERDYSEVGTSYPASLYNIVSDLCTSCGLVLATSAFPNMDYVVSSRPDDDSLTCLAMLSYAAQVCGCWCRVDNIDRLVIDWYDSSAWEGEDWLDGGSFRGDEVPYEDGDDADGGDFSDYSGGSNADGGTFRRNPFHIIRSASSLTICTDDVVITGVKVTAQDQEDDDGTGASGESSLYGEDGYVLSIEGNPLIPYGRASEVASMVGPRIVGMRFRPFDTSALGDPSVEAGDPVFLIDRMQRTYRSYATSVTYKVGGYATLSCKAETPSRNSADTFSSITSAIVGIKNEIKNEKNARQLAVEKLQEELATSSGVYVTEEKQDDGSTIYYFHDKPTIEESKVVWKFTAEALGISTDGGKTYPYGLDVSGTAILDRVYAIGIDASYITSGEINADLIKSGTINASLITTGSLDADLITTGRIRSKDGSVSIDIDTGAVQISGYATDDDVTDAMQDAEDEAKKVATNYLRFDSSGLCVGNMTGTLQGNVVLNGSGMQIRSGSTVLATYGSSTIELGRNSRSTRIELCGGVGTITASSGYLGISSDSGIGIVADGGSLTIGGTEGSDLGALNSVTDIFGTSIFMSTGTRRQYQGIYRLTNPYQSNCFIFMPSGSEMSGLISAGWRSEGIKFYAFA